MDSKPIIKRWPSGGRRKPLTYVAGRDYITAWCHQKGDERWSQSCPAEVNDRFSNNQEEAGKMPRSVHKQRVTAAILFSALVLLIPLSASALNVGDKAPDFLAFSTVGESVRLSDYQGKKNVLIFFFVRAFGGV
jgi:hypothetical protein